MFKRILSFFTTNITAKILALLFALGVWFYVAAGQAKVDVFPAQIPIEIKNLPPQRAVVGDLGTCQVKIKASYYTWQQLSANDFSAYVDLAGLDTGTHQLEINVRVTDSSVSVVEKNPAKVRVKLEPLISKKFPIKVGLEGKPAGGYTTGEISIEPSEVEVNGPQSLVEGITEIKTTIRLSGENTDVERVGHFTALDNSGQKVSNINFSPSSAKIKIPIVKGANIKTVGIRANITGDPKENYWISKIIVTPAVVAVKGEAEILKDLEYLDTEKIDVTDINKTISRDVDLILSRGIILENGSKKIKVMVYVTPNLSVREIPATLIYKGKIGSTSATVKVKVSGPLALLNNLHSSDVLIIIDLTGRGSGSFAIERKDIEAPTGIDVIDFSPKTINIVID